MMGLVGLLGVWGLIGAQAVTVVGSTTTQVLFGSCNSLQNVNPFWPWLAKQDPRVFIWAGDNMYADKMTITFPRGLFKFTPTNITNLSRNYELLNNIPEYKIFKEKKGTSIVGTWDDHDYGTNDGDRTFPLKEESREVFLRDFIGEPSHSPRWAHKGIYHAHYFSDGPGKTLGVVLLDVRFFKDPWSQAPNGDMLGEEQWNWLEKLLCEGEGYVDGVSGNVIQQKTRPRVTLIVSGLQILIENRYAGENWSKFPSSRMRLLELLQKCQVQTPLLLSGDIHMAELHSYQCKGEEMDKISNVMELTSSGMTHSWGTHFANMLPNSPVYLIGRWLMFVAQLVMPWNSKIEHYLGKNMGEILIDWEKETLHLKILGWNFQKGTAYPAFEKELSFSQLGIPASFKTINCEPWSGHPSKAQTFLGISSFLILFLSPVLLPLFLGAKFLKLGFSSSSSTPSSASRSIVTNIYENEDGSRGEVPREWKKQQEKRRGDSSERENIRLRVFQWNILADGLSALRPDLGGFTHQGFSKNCVEWEKRKPKIIAQILRFSPDIFCLQEVDHWSELRGEVFDAEYASIFCPKVKSPALEYGKNPDGCVLAWRRGRFTSVREETFPLQEGQASQVGILVILHDSLTKRDILVATSHLKSTKSAEGEKIREEQVGNLLRRIQLHEAPEFKILCLDANATPLESPDSFKCLCYPKLSQFMTSAYHSILGEELKFSTLKQRGDHVSCWTIDYIFFEGGCYYPERCLDVPNLTSSSTDLRLPNLSFPSDHLNLVVDFIFAPNPNPTSSPSFSGL